MALPVAAARPRSCPACRGRSYILAREGDRSIAQACTCAAQCSRCGGSGHVYVVQEEEFSRKVGKKEYEVLAPCYCRLLKRRLGQYKDACIPGVLSNKGFESFDDPTLPHIREALRVAQTFAYSFKRGSTPKGFILSGPVGTGKSHLLAAVLTHLSLELGISAKYVEISLLFATIRRGFQEGKSGGEIIGPLSEIDVLAIDELGKGRGSPFEMETLDELIARRYNANRTTIFATNYSLVSDKQAAESQSTSGMEDTRKSRRSLDESLSERVGTRIYSRLCEMCEFVQIPKGAVDYRANMQRQASPYR